MKNLNHAKNFIKNEIFSKFRIILRCDVCNLAFHADCSGYEVEEIITGECSFVFCNKCAESNDGQVM